MNFIKAVIQPSYWITHQNPVPDFWQQTLTVVFGLLILCGIIMGILSLVKKFRKPNRTTFGKFAYWGIGMGIWGYIQLFLSVQRVSFVSARLLYLVWLAGLIYFGYRVFYYTFKVRPKLIEQQKEREKKEKYLPKKNN